MLGSRTLPSAAPRELFRAWRSSSREERRRKDGGELPISSTEYRINDRIRSQKCRLIGIDGSQLGIFVTSEALRIADDQGLDLVEIAPTAKPPVCKVMDYGKYLFQQKKKQNEAKKKQKVIVVKEVQFRPRIDEHDFNFKRNHVLRFLADGDKVKATVRFRGREMAHQELGRAVLDRLLAEVKEKGAAEGLPMVQGNRMAIIIGPVSQK